jgi:hypothetical protein
MKGRFLPARIVVRGSRGRSPSKIYGLWRAAVPGRRRDFHVRIVISRLIIAPNHWLLRRTEVAQRQAARAR